MHSAICSARTAPLDAGVNRAASSLTHELSPNLPCTLSSSERASERFLLRGFHSVENSTDDAARPVRTNSAAVDSYGGGGLHAATSAAARSPPKLATTDVAPELL